MENGGNRGPRLATATRVLGVTADLIDAFFEYVAIPIAEEWTERPGGHQARVVDRDSEWCGLSVTFYVNTAAVLFQGPPTVSNRARLLLVDFVNSGSFL